MRYVLLKDVKPGMVLAQEVLDPSGRTLAEENSKITQYAIEKLTKIGYDGLYIQDDFSAGIQIEAALKSNLWAAAMDCVRRRDINGCRKASNEIVEALWGKKEVSLDFSEFRTNENYIYAHSVNVATLSCLVGIGCKLGLDEMRNLVFAALIHDLGKLDIPTLIRNKAGLLSRDEFRIMKNHAVLSYELIKDRVDVSAHVKKAVRSHHENEDGSGYPDGLLGEELSIYTKILHVADVYDALVSRSPYKKPYSPQEAAEYLMGGCGTLFDQDVVMTLLKYVPMYPKGSDVILSDGRTGIVKENTGVHNLRPIVRLYDGITIDLSEPEYFSMTIELKDTASISEEYEYQRKEMLGKTKRYRIMVVDDMRTNLQMMQDMLGDTYDLVLAKSGEQALSYMDKKAAPDLILMDIDMPGMDGIEAAIRIAAKSGSKHIPLVFVTSLCDKDTVMKCRTLKPESYIVRPYKPVYVKTEIRRILEGWGH